MYYIKKAEYKLNGITTFSLEWEGKNEKIAILGIHFIFQLYVKYK